MACWKARWTAATSISIRSSGPAPPAPTWRWRPSGLRPIGRSSAARWASRPARFGFDEYWKRWLDELHIDPPVREHLRGVASMAFLPWPLRALAGPFNLFATTGFLAPEFRAMMRLDWSRGQQRRFEWLLAAL